MSSPGYRVWIDGMEKEVRRLGAGAPPTPPDVSAALEAARRVLALPGVPPWVRVGVEFGDALLRAYAARLESQRRNGG